MKKATSILALCLAILTLTSVFTFPAAARSSGHDANGCRKLAEQVYYGYEGNVNGKDVYEYDEAGHLTRHSEYEWDDEKEELVEIYRTCYTYNENGDVLTQTDAHPDYNEPFEMYVCNKRAYTYDAEGKLKSFTYSYANKSADPLTVSYEHVYTYEGNKRIRNQNDNRGGVMVSSGLLWEIFDEQGNVTESITFREDEGKMFPSYKYVYEYDEAGRVTLERYVDLDDDFTEEPEGETRYTYDARGNMTSEVDYGYHEVEGQYEAIPEDRTTWTYDEQDRETEEFHESYHEQVWYPSDRTVRTYFENFPARMTYAASYFFEGDAGVSSNTWYEWDEDADALVIDTQEVYSFGTDGLSLEYVYSRYDDETEALEARSKTVVTFTDDTCTEAISTRYRMNEGKLDEDDRYRITLAFDDADNVTQIRYFEYDNDEAKWLSNGGCDITYTEAKYHTGLVAVEAVNATCDAAGHATYYVCECGHEAYTDPEGKSKIADLHAWLEGEGKIETLPHEFSHGVCVLCGARKGLSAGAVIGIVIGSIVLLALIAYVVLFFVWKKKQALPEALGFLGFLVPSFVTLNDLFSGDKAAAASDAPAENEADETAEKEAVAAEASADEGKTE